MNRTGLPMYEGDSLIRHAASLDPVALDTIERNARHLRSRTIGDLLERAANWLEHAVWRARQREIAAILSQATDHADLERRMKSLHAG